MIDVAATRDRLRRAVAGAATAVPFDPEGRVAPGSTRPRYRDADTAPLGAARQRAAAGGDRSGRPDPAPLPDDGLRVAPPSGGFVDLDAVPLTLAAVAPPPDRPRTAPDPGDDADAAPAPTPDDRAAPAPRPDAAPATLDPPLMRRIIFHATADPDTQPPFARAQPNLTGEGLLYGIGRFTQASGDLGRLLLAMRQMDGAAFAAIFGPEAEALVAVTTAPDATEGAPGAASRLDPVGGEPLWSPDWIARFKAAAQHPPFRDAQYMVAAHTALLPMLGFARAMGLASEKGLALLTERAIQTGIAAAKDLAATAAGPLTTEALKRAALVHVLEDPAGTTLSDFQAAHGLPDTAGRLDAETHAALFAALRAAGDGPVPLPSVPMMLDRIVRAAEDGPIPGRARAIRNNPTLSEEPLAAADPVME